VQRTARARLDPFEGEMRIGVIPTVASYALPAFTAAVRKAYPRLSILWVEEKTSVLVARLEAGELEAAVLALEADIGGLAHETLAEDTFVLAGAPTHPLLRARAPLRGIEALSGETLHLLDEGHCFRDQARDLCSRVGLREAEFRATSLTTLVQVVLGAGGLTLLPALSLPVENRSHELAVRSFAKPSPARTLALAFRGTSPVVESLRALAQVMRRAYPKTRA
jgi:LysR family hydrogen peroxide-inducible transcriptional activator